MRISDWDTYFTTNKESDVLEKVLPLLPPLASHLVHLDNESMYLLSPLQ
jgi:hypothetical protein